MESMNFFFFFFQYIILLLIDNFEELDFELFLFEIQSNVLIRISCLDCRVLMENKFQWFLCDLLSIIYDVRCHMLWLMDMVLHLRVVRVGDEREGRRRSHRESKKRENLDEMLTSDINHTN